MADKILTHLKSTATPEATKLLDDFHSFPAESQDYMASQMVGSDNGMANTWKYVLQRFIRPVDL